MQGTPVLELNPLPVVSGTAKYALSTPQKVLDVPVLLHKQQGAFDRPKVWSLTSQRGFQLHSAIIGRESDKVIGQALPFAKGVKVQILPTPIAFCAW